MKSGLSVCVSPVASSFRCTPCLSEYARYFPSSEIASPVTGLSLEFAVSCVSLNSRGALRERPCVKSQNQSQRRAPAAVTPRAVSISSTLQKSAACAAHHLKLRRVPIRNRNSFSRELRTHRRHKPVAPPRNRFNVSRLFRIVAQRHANLIHARIDPTIKIHKRIPAPKALPDFIAANNLAGPFGKQLQHAERLRMDFQRNSGFTQFSAQPRPVRTGRSKSPMADGLAKPSTSPAGSADCTTRSSYKRV